MTARLNWCWFALALAVALALVGLSARWKILLFDRITLVSGGPPPAGGAEGGRNRLVPLQSFDGLYWIAYAQQMAATGAWRVRETRLDNAPDGRAMHWSSGLSWWLVALGRVRQFATREPLPQAIEYAAAWANPVLLLLVLTGFSLVTARRYGPVAGGLVALAFAGSAPIYETFAANQPDHHGLINAAAFGTVAFLLMGGAGWVRRDPAEENTADRLLLAPGGARRWFIASAASGAAGMWFSAASQIQVLAGVGLATLVAAIVIGRARPDDEAVAQPGLWRTWGRWGAGLSFGFYLLEYFPAHFAMRLEVNHPLYCVAWWGAGELLAAFAAWRDSGQPPWSAAPRDRRIFLATIAAVAAPPLALALGGAWWFVPLDPVLRVLPTIAVEGLSLAKQLRAAGWQSALLDVAPTGALLALGLGALALRGRPRIGRVLAWWPLVVMLPIGTSALMQGRWFVIVATLAVVPGIAAMAAWRTRLPRAAGAGLLLVLAAVMLGARAIPEARKARAESAAPLSGLGPGLRHMLALRHIAQALRQQVGPQADPIVLSGTDESPMLAYYGRLRTVGTLYWENLAGLKAAAAIYSAADLPTAKRLLAARGVTHLLSYPAGNSIAQYAIIARGQPTASPGTGSFAQQIFMAETFPVWLRPLALRVPVELSQNHPAALYQFVPDQTEAETRFHLALFLLEAGRLAPAHKLLFELMQQFPADTAVRLALVNALLAAGELAQADAVVEQAPATPACAELRRVFGEHLQRRGNFARARDFYSTAVAAAPGDAAAHQRLAWLLAAGPDARLRDGLRAVALARRAVELDPGAPNYATLGAALAEAGAFADAAKAAEQAIRLAQAAGNSALAAEVSRHLALYAKSMPWHDPPVAPAP